MSKALAVQEVDETAKPHLVIVSNPAAFSAEEVTPRLDELEQLPEWGSTDRIETTPDDSYIDKLRSCLRPGSTVAIAGGDGTVKHVFDALFDMECIDDITVLIVGAGNKNDVAHMLHGKHYNDPVTVVQKGRTRTIFPIEAHLLGKDGGVQRTERALYSFSLGATAIGARLFNEAGFRQKQRARSRIGRWLAEQWLALDAIMRAGVVQTDKGLMLDITVAGGNRMAGGALKFDTQLTHPIELAIARTKSNPLSVLGTIVARKLRRGRGPGDSWVGGHETIQVNTPVPAQADGEVITPVPAGTTLYLRRARKGLTVLALK